MDLSLQIAIDRLPDGECDVSIARVVRGQRVYFIQALGAPVGERLLDLALAADAARRAGARELVAIVPNLGYARHDRRKKEGVALGAAVVAKQISSCGFDRLVVLDLHSPSIEGFFSCAVEHITAAPLLAMALRPHGINNAVVVAPDFGASALARSYARRLGLPHAFVRKTRLGPRDVVAHQVMGDVRGKRPIIVDDMISTGATVAAAVKAVVAAGAMPEIVVAATHGVFAPGSAEVLALKEIHAVLVTDSLDPIVAPSEIPVQRVSLASLLSDVVSRIEGDRSLEDLLAEV